MHTNGRYARARARGRAAVMAMAWLMPAAAVMAQDPARGLGHERGSADAKVVVVELLDFGCSACAQFTRDVMPRLMREYVDTGLVLWRALPFSAGFANGRESARAAECAAEQGGFWAMHDRLYAGQGEWERLRDPRPRFEEYATALGLDPVAFTMCYRMAAVDERRERNDRLARQLGVPGTPAFLIGEQRIVGAVPYELFRQYLERALGRSPAPVRQARGAGRARGGPHRDRRAGPGPPPVRP